MKTVEIETFLKVNTKIIIKAHQITKSSIKIKMKSYIKILILH